jgi:TonB family protein
MSTIALHTGLPWSAVPEEERRFRRILRSNLLAILVLGLIVPFLPLPESQQRQAPEPPAPVATLVFEQKPAAPPPPVARKPVSEPKPEAKKKVEPAKPASKPATKVRARPNTKPQQQSRAVKPEPVKPKPSAREVAQQSGLLAMTDALAELRRNTVAGSVTRTRELSSSGGTARTVERAVLSAGTTTASDGIHTARLSRNTGGGELSARSTAQIQSPGGNAAATASIGGRGRGERTAGRSIEEIQMVFDRNKGAIYSVYNRALRKDPTLQGKLVLQLTIAPSGKVTACNVVSSELQDPALDRKIGARVKLFDFGARDVETVTITYPIDFLPA